MGTAKTGFREVGTCKWLLSKFLWSTVNYRVDCSLQSCQPSEQTPGYPTETTIRNSGRSTLNLSAILANKSTGKGQALGPQIHGKGSFFSLWWCWLCSWQAWREPSRQFKLCASLMGTPCYETTCFAFLLLQSNVGNCVTVILVRIDQNVTISQLLRWIAFICFCEKTRDERFQVVPVCTGTLWVLT